MASFNDTRTYQAELAATEGQDFFSKLFGSQGGELVGKVGGFLENRTTANTGAISAGGQDTLAAGYSKLAPLLTSTAYTKDAAIVDSKLAAESALQSVLKLGLPQLYNLSNSSGAYNSTTAGLLQNDLLASAAAESAKVQLATVSQYAQNRQLELSPLFKILEADLADSGNKSRLAAAQAQSNSKGKSSGLSDLGGLFNIGKTIGKLFL